MERLCSIWPKTIPGMGDWYLCFAQKSGIMGITKFPVWKTSQNRKRSDAGYESNRNESAAGRQRCMAGRYTRNHTKTLLLLWHTQFKGFLLECDSIQPRRRLCVPQSSPVGGAVLCDSRQRRYYGYGKIFSSISKKEIFFWWSAERSTEFSTMEINRCSFC